MVGFRPLLMQSPPNLHQTFGRKIPSQIGWKSHVHPNNFTFHQLVHHLELWHRDVERSERGMPPHLCGSRRPGELRRLLGGAEVSLVRSGGRVSEGRWDVYNKTCLILFNHIVSYIIYDVLCMVYIYKMYTSCSNIFVKTLRSKKSCVGMRLLRRVPTICRCSRVVFKSFIGFYYSSIKPSFGCIILGYISCHVHAFFIPFSCLFSCLFWCILVYLGSAFQKSPKKIGFVCSVSGLHASLDIFDRLNCPMALFSLKLWDKHAILWLAKSKKSNALSGLFKTHSLTKRHISDTCGWR